MQFANQVCGGIGALQVKRALLRQAQVKLAVGDGLLYGRVYLLVIKYLFFGVGFPRLGRIYQCVGFGLKIAHPR